MSGKINIKRGSTQMKSGTQLLMKPECELSSENGNIYNLLLVAVKTLKGIGMKEEAREMKERVLESDDYTTALLIIGEYVEIQ